MAFGISTLVELLQLTALPSALSAIVPPMRLVLGTTFSIADLPAYALGALLVLLLDCWLMRLTHRCRSSRQRVSASSR